MKSLRLMLVLLLIMIGTKSVFSADDSADPLAELGKKKNPDRIPISPVAVQWKFSADGGKTFALDSLPDVPANTKPEVIASGTFKISDPAEFGTLWITTDSPVGGIAAVNDVAIGRRYVGRIPVLLMAKVMVNGKPLVLPEGDDAMLLERYGIDPVLLQKGDNVITVRGLYWNTCQNLGKGYSVKVGFRLSSTPVDAVELRSGPILGPLGSDYFTLVCRTHIPAEIKVAVKPVDPAGDEKVHDFPRGTLHRCRLDLPKGTKKFQYTVTAKNGSHSKSAGPYEVRVPSADSMRFVVLGQTAADRIEGLIAAAKALQKTDPDFIIHTGSIVKMAYWDYEWDNAFFIPWKDLLARTPICVVPAYRDSYSMAFCRLFYHATPDGNWGPWTWSIGNVRFLGMDSMGAAQNADAVGKWIEEVLKSAKEEYVFSVNSYPGYVDKPFGRGIDGNNFDKNVVHPLLAKYKATAALGCTGAYQYVPAPEGGKGVQTIITGGVGAEMNPGWKTCHYCIFTVKPGKCDMEAFAYEDGNMLDKKSFTPRK